MLRRVNVTLGKLRKSLLFCTVFILAACQNNDGAQKSIINDEPVNEAEETSQLPETEEIKKHDKEMRSAKEIKENALYTWPINDTTEIILVKEEGNLEVMKDNTALGEAGERQFTGDVALFIIHENEENGYLQEKITDVYLNIDRTFSEPYTFNGESFIVWIQPEASNINTLTMWRYVGGELQRVLFDGTESMIVSNMKMKFLKDTYLQTYVYNNHGTDEGGSGWYYTTWKWEEEGKFSTHSKEQYTDATPYGWETGEQLTKVWHEHPEEYIAFPELTLAEDVIELIKNGQLVKDGIRLGQPIDEVLTKMPNFTDHDYYKGGPYYSFPGPFSYFYDELTKEVSYILLNGASLTNDLASIKSIFGEPEDDYPNMIDDYYSLVYTIDDKKLRIEYEENGRMIGVWLSQSY